MNYKVFMKIFFEKPKYFLIYALMMTTFWYVLFIGVADSMFIEYYEKRTPDIEITGKMTDNEKNNVHFQGMDFSLLNQMHNKSTQIYGVKARNVYLISDTEDTETYPLYGVDEGFIDELKGYLKRGKLPKTGNYEALIGSDLAKYLKAGVGDVLVIPVTAAEKDIAKYEYTISGILKGEMTFYKDGIYVLKDTLPQAYLESGDNVIYIYTESNYAYKEVIKQLEKLDKNAFGNILLHRQEKVSLFDTMMKSLINTIPFSAVFLSALFVSLLKYTGRKIGLMKALGLSDRNIMKILLKGFGVFNFCGILNSFVAMGFIRLTSGSPLPITVYIYTVSSYAIIFMVTILLLSFMCKTISPQKAMCPY